MKKRRLFTTAFLGVSLLGTSGWLAVGELPKLRAKRPAETQRAIEFQKRQQVTRLERASFPKTPRNAPKTLEHEEVIQVYLSRAELTSFPLSTGLDIGPQDYVPMLDEAPWPDLESVLALQDLADALRNTDSSVDDSYERFMEEAELDGLLSAEVEELTAEPWLGLVAMYAHYGKELPQAFWDNKAPFNKTNEFARALIEQYPDEPVGDYARLLFLHTSNERAGGAQDPAEQQTHLIDILHDSSDPVVLQASLEELNRIQSPEQDPAIEQWLETHLNQWSPELIELVAVGRMSHFSKANDPEQTQKWMKRYADAIDEKCLEQSCDLEESSLNEFRARTNVRWNIQPNSWNEALIQHVYRCNESHPFTEAVQATITWDGQAWSPSENLSICAHYLPKSLGPLTPKQVRIDVFPAD